MLEARIDISNGDAAKAAQALKRAVAKIPLPEYQWALADAARLAGDTDLARRTEEALMKNGATGDPRTFALFLATRQVDIGKALKLAQAELTSRWRMTREPDL